MMLAVLVSLVSAALGFGVAFLVYRSSPKPFTGIRKFRVILHTDSGAQARRLFERVVPVGDGVAEFLERDICRSIKGKR